MLIFERLNPLNAKYLVDFLINNQDVGTFFQPHPFTKEAIAHILDSRKEDEFIVMRLNDKGYLGGVIGYGLLRGWDEGYERPSLGITVDKNYRGEGYGKRMMEYLHQLAREHGATEVRLTIEKENVVARNFYKGMGYKFHAWDNEKDEGVCSRHSGQTCQTRSGTCQRFSKAPNLFLLTVETLP